MEGVLSEDFDPRAAEEQLFKDFAPDDWEDDEKNSKDVDSIDETLEKAKAVGFNFMARDGLGQRFDRWLRKVEQAPMKDKCDKMPRDLKSKFRQQWGKERFADYEEGRKHINSETHKNRQIGTYLNFDQLLNEEGGRQSQAAGNPRIHTLRSRLPQDGQEVGQA